MTGTERTSSRFFRAGAIRGAAIGMALLAPLVAALSGACTIKSYPSKGTGTGTLGVGGTGGSGSSASSSASSGSGGGSGGGPAIVMDNRQFFEAKVLPGMQANCEPCHVNQGFADFIAPPDPYQSITIYKSGTDHQPLLVPDPTQSILYTYPDSPDHTGTKFTPAHDDLKTNILAWLTREAGTLPPQPEAGPMTYLVPFKPILGGFNAIYLDKLGPDYVGSSIVFTAAELSVPGSPPSLLKLSNLQVYPVGLALHMVHPRFQVYPGGNATPQYEPSDGLSDVDTTFFPNSTQHTLGPGELLIDNWQQNARIGIDFSQGSITALHLTGDGGVVPPCTSVANYQMAVTTLGMGGPLYCATNCHGGNKPTAQAAMDLSGLLASPPDYATACSYMKTRITPGVPSTSEILDVTNPAHTQVVHMYKFAGDPTAYMTFSMGISPWIMGEQ